MQQLLHMDYTDWRAGEILKCLFTWSTCVWQPKALLWEQWLLVWAIPCIKNSGENLNLRRGDAVLVLLVVLALVRHLILRLYVYVENKWFGSDKNMVIWILASFLAGLICLVTKLLVTSSLARSFGGVRSAQKKHVTFKYTWQWYLSTFLNPSVEISSKEDNMPVLKMLPVAAEYHMLLM